jgi:hypothetical protein
MNKARSNQISKVKGLVLKVKIKTILEKRDMNTKDIRLTSMLKTGTKLNSYAGIAMLTCVTSLQSQCQSEMRIVMACQT